ncbi:UNVERIFIED_CONTAM: hypothetical protein Sradi_0700500 [Sesamum radiatum]|uniref:Integrase catalytic domain-containing protein n=1 Tax=Sesamum radiatum TaxID=300843 RepID=A0AAW2VPP3_SESRA
MMKRFKLWKKPILEFVVLTNWDQSYTSASREWVIWPTMVKDCMDYAVRCQACQFHANLIYQPPEPLHLTISSWPFDACDLDVVGPMIKSSGGHLYILAATDYFSKWAEAVSLKEVKNENVADFIRTNIIYRYRVPNLLKKAVVK